ncbi:BlaI/MecI/CopY family transcriptional regulator [Pseudoalteromonas ruthenica]|uniref:BlaI/MecI/CopY family transcriptional regulator n=1 Tax=Pseudoalteromonas ruthenica TaxID=151081 RepID=UPI00242040CE|nr:BlaI/MecI/CopY family transcriptional regulator [Pseudoalteromonas ruthenica]|tara:strand:+ start:21121 stop:21498 length:378 start_codon:yes stop_codon:yes gene_type:complete
MIELSKAEFAVMEALWQGHPAKASEVVARLSDDTQWHEKTIKTLLGRLVKKQAVSFEKQGRLYSYTPTIGREEYTLKQSRSLIQRFFSGRIAPLVSGFAKTEQLSQQDINELKAVIKEWEDQQGK